MSRSARAAQLCADTGISLQAAARQFGITHTAVWFAWRKLFGERNPESLARRQARDANIAALADQGWTTQRLAAHFHLSPFSIRRITKRLGSFARDAYNVEPDAVKGALRMVRRGATYRQAARAEGLGETTVARYAKAAGLKPGKPKRTKRRPEPDEYIVEDRVAERRAAQAMVPDTGRYRPLDTILSDWCVLVLRAASRFDWAEPADLSLALDVPSKTVDPQRRNCFDVTMSKLTRRGHLERRGRPMAYQYRITEAGRLELERQLKRSAA